MGANDGRLEINQLFLADETLGFFEKTLVHEFHISYSRTE